MRSTFDDPHGSRAWNERYLQSNGLHEFVSGLVRARVGVTVEGPLDPNPAPIPIICECGVSVLRSEHMDEHLGGEVHRERMAAVVVVGFTGTREGCTDAQAAAMAGLLHDLRCSVLHHGDCVGADAQAHEAARSLGVPVELHPPSSPQWRAFCRMLPGEVVRPELDYIERNRAIVHACAVLVACPKEEEGHRQGIVASCREHNPRT